MDKSQIFLAIQNKLSDKIDKLEHLIAETRASNNETKSSMGDKYETSREMVQQQINNLQVQLNELFRQQDFLKTFQPKASDKAEKGAVIETEKGMFYISVSLGEIIVEKRKIIAISPESPLAIAMQGKIKNEIVSINNINQTIKNIW